MGTQEIGALKERSEMKDLVGLKKYLVRLRCEDLFVKVYMFGPNPDYVLNAIFESIGNRDVVIISIRETVSNYD